MLFFLYVQWSSNNAWRELSEPGKGVDAETAASFAGMFCIGITIGRGINGFIAMKLKDAQMIGWDRQLFLRESDHVLPLENRFSDWIFLIGLAVRGISMYHSFHTEHFGAERSRQSLGEMASAYIGTV